jgi:dihydrofolate reductase
MRLMPGGDQRSTTFVPRAVMFAKPAYLAALVELALDGYASAVGWPGYWGLEGPEYLAWLDQSPERHYTALMGGTTYRLMSDFAATSDDPSFAQLTEMSKVVFSSTLKNPLAWANTRLVDQDPVAAVRSMKEAAARPLRTIGSLTLCRSLLEAGLVDRFRVVVFPVITGSTGRERIFYEYPDVGLEMVASRTFDGRLQLLEYVPTVLTGPPSGGQPT